MVEIKLDWEQVGGHLSRLKVPGGWLVKIEEWKKDFFNDKYWGMALTFYPDPDHKWLKDTASSIGGSDE